MRYKKAMLAGFLAGMASPLNLFEPRERLSLEGNDLSRMRGDIERVGSDFAKAIGRYEKKNPTTSNAAGPHLR